MHPTETMLAGVLLGEEAGMQSECAFREVEMGC